ncbi:MAG TPA: hypothetical protein VFT55_16780 [Planctomycetota bacterium]|nr:hypothetical protein [Planctomycetota bacterium]
MPKLQGKSLPRIPAPPLLVRVLCGLPLVLGLDAEDIVLLAIFAAFLFLAVVP